MDCCKDAKFNLIVDKSKALAIGKLLISNNILIEEQLDLIMSLGKYTSKINLLTFESEYIETITKILHKNQITEFNITKQFK
jgi:hypothetical protein